MSDHYCVYFDHNYAPLGLAMLRSLRACGGRGTAWVICLSKETEELVATFDVEDIEIVPLAAIEAHFPALEAAKQDRSRIEYYFTLTPHVVRYVFDREPSADRVAYLDSDLFFFGPVEQMWAAAGIAPAAIIRHNFHASAAHLVRYGEYNVGWVSFARSDQGLACLDFWCRSCAEWCGDTPDGDRFADQGYLGRFYEFAPDLAVIGHKGCNVGPWNIARYPVHLATGQVTIGGDPLIFFHFTGFKKRLMGRWFNSHRMYRTGTTTVVRDHIYRPYLTALLAAKAYVAAHRPPEAAKVIAGTALKRNRGGGFRLKARLYKLVETAFLLLDLATGKAIAEPKDTDASRDHQDRG
jgi:hypothetical protein